MKSRQVRKSDDKSPVTYKQRTSELFIMPKLQGNLLEDFMHKYRSIEKNFVSAVVCVPNGYEVLKRSHKNMPIYSFCGVFFK